MRIVLKKSFSTSHFVDKCNKRTTRLITVDTRHFIVKVSAVIFLLLSEKYFSIKLSGLVNILFNSAQMQEKFGVGA